MSNHHQHKLFSKNKFFPHKFFSAKKNHYFGLYCEKIVMIFLWLKGYKILNHRYKDNYGEIDIIAKKGQFIIFIEVKASFSKIDIEKVLTNQQIKRIKNSAQNYIGKRPHLHKWRRRFDFVEATPYLLFILKIKHRINFIS